MKLYWWIVALLFLPPFVGFGLESLAQYLGCLNVFERGCAPGIGNTLAVAGLLLFFVGFLTSFVGAIMLMLGLAKRKK